MPSRRTQIAATAAALPVSIWKAGRASLARSTNSRTASERRSPSAEASSSAAGSDSGGARHLTSPGAPRGSRLVAMMGTFGHLDRTAGMGPLGGGPAGPPVLIDNNSVPYAQ